MSGFFLPEETNGRESVTAFHLHQKNIKQVKFATIWTPTPLAALACCNLLASVERWALVVLLLRRRRALVWAKVVQYFGVETRNFLPLFSFFQLCLAVMS